MSLTPIQNNFSNIAGTAGFMTGTANTAKAENASFTQTEKAAVAVKNTAKLNRDTFEKNNNIEAAPTAPKRLTADQLKELQEQQVQSFQKMLSGMLTTQADKANLARNGIKAINADLFSRLTVTPDQQAAAQKAISEDGEWGVNAVATRIVDMAVSLSGGDSSKISELRTAVEKGFKQAGVQWGQKLPSITDDTHKEINKRFDYWEENGSMDGYEYGVSKE